MNAAPRPSSRKRLLWIVVLALCAVVAALAILRLRKTHSAAPPAMAAQGERPVPVLLGVVESRDMPVYLDGLGTVVPVATVTVRSQVDGRLEKITFVEGQSVKKGDVLAEIDPRAYRASLHQAQAVLKKDEAQLANAKQTLDRLKRLRGESLASQQELDDQAAIVAQLEGQVLADRALGESSRLSLDFAKIRSPIDGVVGVRMVDQGNIVRAGDSQGIVVVTSLDPITVVFPVPQDQVPAIIAAKQAGALPVTAFARDGKEPLARGELLVVDNQIDPQTSMVKLKAQLPNADRKLWPGAFVRARLELAVKKGAMVVAEGAVQHGPEGAFVYVVGEGDRVEMRPVTAEHGDGERVIVTSGLEVGQRVVVDGQSQLRVGTKVVPRGGPR